MPPGYLVFVLGKHREPLDRFELRLVRRTLRLRHMLERLPKAGSAVRAHRLQASVIALQLVLRRLQFEKRRRPHAQFSLVHRFCDEVVRPCLNRVQPMLAGRQRGYHDDREVMPRWVLTNATADVETIEPWHDDVEQD